MKASQHLTKHAIKSIIENFEGVSDSTLVVQVIDVKSFEDQKKNIKARVTLSDGVSKMLAFVTNKAHEELVSNKLMFMCADVERFRHRKIQRVESQSA